MKDPSSSTRKPEPATVMVSPGCASLTLRVSWGASWMVSVAVATRSLTPPPRPTVPQGATPSSG